MYKFWDQSKKNISLLKMSNKKKLPLKVTEIKKNHNKHDLQ